MKYLADTVTLSYRAELCTRCGRCVEVCPRGVFALGLRAAEVTDRDLCIECGACARNCPAAAIEVEAGVGCAEAVINGMLRGGAPVCGCGDTPGGRSASCCGGPAGEDASPAGEASCCGEPSAADTSGCGCSEGSSGGSCC